MHEAFNISNILQLTVQIECIAAHDNFIQVHDINGINFPVVQQIENSKGASLFALNIQHHKTMSGENVAVVRMCVAVKRRLYLYYWKKPEFVLFANSDVTLKDIPKTLVWGEQTVCVGYKGEYCLHKVLQSKDDGQQDLFTTGSRSSEPCLTKITDTSFALGRENQTVVVNDKGSAEKSKVLKWSDTPTGLVWDNPYLLGILSDSIEIQHLDPGGLIQTLPNLPKVRFIVRARQGLLIAASVSSVWYINAIEVATQRKVLLDSKQFELAIQLTHTSNETEDEKKEIIHHIHTLLAYDLFKKKDFFASMKEFLILKTDPYDVIRLFPDLLPQSTPATNQESHENLTDTEKENGIQALIDYLTEIRRNTQTDVQGSVNASGNLNERSACTKSTQQLLQIIDTTLLKCYLQTNDALIAPLLRLNYCHLGETERILKKHEKHNELIILYQVKGHPRKALELLQSEGTIDRNVSYLQKLGSDHIGLILEFADWVLKKAPEEGLKIFTEELPEVEQLPRPRVLDYLIRSHPSLVIPYAEHVVHTWNDTNPLFHNTLVHFYKEKALSGDTSAVHAHKKLFDFLQKSPHYTPDTVLMSFPTNNLLEERAIILGKLGRHEQALIIYMRVLGDVAKAIEYCESVYDPMQPTSKDVYMYLLQVILDPNKATLLLPDVNFSPKTSEPDVEMALEFLEKYAPRINPFKALTVLPSNIPVSRINKFLQISLHEKVKERRRVQLLKGLLYAENLQCQEIRLQLLNKNFVISDLNLCPVCKKRFGNQSALVRYPNGDVVHYSCQDKKL
ncbi:cnh domain containing [Holotrichia oblita]|uniref:Cnh domain containing n=1 Tax=Holotrichia oblita TaxID=644536 RepID=A0ACB9TA47_HOLOL|nr:cnh domain containing [Holotrichia oblita]